MSPIIKILPEHIVNKIAAGEVVERPASVVKELIENAIDAGATEVLVDIEQEGRRLIRVSDDGSGMSGADARLAFERHATSKIRTDADLEAVRTMGFRGEALSSIASVSHVRLLTAERKARTGTVIEIEGGTIRTAADSAASAGTTIEISHLFYNTPARRKFLKSPATEFSHIVVALSRQAMAHPATRFRLTHNKKMVLDLPPAQAARERVFQLYGRDIADNVIEFSGGRDAVLLHGLLSRPGYGRADKTYQEFYVNGRAIRNASLAHALASAYGDMLMRDRHPIGFVFIDIDPGLVDVNVHPAKAEVRFRNQAQVHDLVRDVIRESLRGSGPVPAARHVPVDGVKDAIADYLRSAESGVLSAEPVPSGNQYRPEFRGAESSRSSRLMDVQSELVTPHSALLQPLAQIHDSFIVAQSSAGMVLVDQHAAHERVLFEKLQDQFGRKSFEIQNLLIPVQVDPGTAHRILLSEYLPELVKLGFVVEEFGGDTFLIKGVPALIAGADYKQLLLDVLDEVSSRGRSGRMDDLRDQILSVMACHPAIKIHRRLDRQEMERLVQDLLSCRMPYTCPHGRPTIVTFTVQDLNRLFKRI